MENTYKKNKKSVWQEYKKNKYLFLLLLPVIVYFIIFHYVPMYGAIISFKEFYPRLGIWGSKWVGLEHFKRLFSGIYFFPVLRNTLIISFGKLLFGFPAPIILCILLNEVRRKRFKKAVQTITYLPHFISWVVLAGIVMEVLSPSRGIINYIIQAIGFDPIFFIAEKNWFRKVVVSSSIWRNTGWETVIYMAAIVGINPQLYESAEIDGANRFKKIFHITLPSITPTIIIMLIFAIGRIITDDFDQIYNLLNAKVMDVGDVISTYTYRVGLEQMNYSYSAAVGLFKNIISLVMVMTSNFIAKKISGNSLW
ncbi:MAG: ABC transporter permease subunit [Vallitalea sp.]|jgi:putative aldouronate transport system permease protein|nr:ABC transporter permease subunit [Vallitalea sp.]